MTMQDIGLRPATLRAYSGADLPSRFAFFRTAAGMTAEGMRFAAPDDVVMRML